MQALFLGLLLLGHPLLGLLLLDLLSLSIQVIIAVAPSFGFLLKQLTLIRLIPLDLSPVGCFVQ